MKQKKSPLSFKLIAQPKDYFNILPLDWIEILKFHGLLYKTYAQIYGLYEAQELIAGGIVFQELLPGSTTFEVAHSQVLFKEVGAYIGFVWVLPERRGEKLGSLWLKSLFKKFPKSSFWLSIEEKPLANFYHKLSFTVYKTHSEKGQFLEQILVYQPEYK
jgi:GNAT superfamily N-acetyltransferase